MAIIVVLYIEVIKTQDNFKPVYLFIYFDKKILRAQKHVTRKN